MRFSCWTALNGFRPIVEFNFSGLVFAHRPIFNQASKYKQMLGGKKNIPIDMATGTKGGLAAHHSDNPYSILTHLGMIYANKQKTFQK